MSIAIRNFEALLAQGKDSALLRYTLGKAYLDQEQAENARSHLQQATALDPDYSVAWKLLGKAELALGDTVAARRAWQQGLACAHARGDAQVVKELQVFLRRLDKQAGMA
ncbi:tetratricopeptide repeat protein [Comamonas terrae]|uniref:Tetratricopeptide repeat protein n=1 Tax=Comamonas terrae TaxID=673548 RepID=A0ABW5UKU7_9BURK|nr:tetratricopeptide repeat protein [Comamonas terrae]